MVSVASRERTPDESLESIAGPAPLLRAELVGMWDADVQFTYAFWIPLLFFDAPHSHSAAAHLFVARGELLLGYGETFDRSRLERYPAGSFLWVQAGAAHFDGADTETVLIGTATGP